MNKAEFLAALTAQIRDLSREDIARSLEYYSEMIDEQVEDGISVEDAIAALGSPEEIGEEILNALPRERKTFEESREGKGQDFVGKSIQDSIDYAMSISKEACEDAMQWAGQLAAEGAGATHIHVDRGERRHRDESGGSRVNTYEYIFREAFEAVDIRVGSADVRLMRSAGPETLVVSKREADRPEKVEIRDGVLVIEQPVRGKQAGGIRLFDFSFHFGHGGSVSVYLPERIWKSMQISSLSGDLEVEDIHCESAYFKSTSGDIEGRHMTVSGPLEMEAMSGDITLLDFKGSDVEISSMSGDIQVEQANGKSFSAKSQSGDIVFENVLTVGKLRGESTSGDVKLHRSDAGTLDLRSVSGDIQASLLSGKVFLAQSTTGDVRVPESAAGAGECRANTSSGDIKIRLAP